MVSSHKSFSTSCLNDVGQYSNENESLDSTTLFNNSIAGQDQVLLTKKQLALQLQISVKTIDKLVCRRAIPFIKIGRNVRFNQEKVHAWLLQRSHS